MSFVLCEKVNKNKKKTWKSSKRKRLHEDDNLKRQSSRRENKILFNSDTSQLTRSKKTTMRKKFQRKNTQ